MYECKFIGKNVPPSQNAECKASDIYCTMSQLNYVLKPYSQCTGNSKIKTLGGNSLHEDM